MRNRFQVFCNNMAHLRILREGENSDADIMSSSIVLETLYDDSEQFVLHVHSLVESKDGFREN